MRFSLLLLPLLLFLSSCKGHRFYWETRFTVETQTPEMKEVLMRAFKLTGKMSDWHPVFGQYCMSLPSYQAHLFVCWKGQMVKVTSSYNGILKGDDIEKKGPRTVHKYLSKVTNQPGYEDHASINEYIDKHYRVKLREDRLLVYGRGSVLLKEELENSSSP